MAPSHSEFKHRSGTRRRCLPCKDCLIRRLVVCVLRSLMRSSNPAGQHKQAIVNGSARRCGKLHQRPSRTARVASTPFFCVWLMI